MEAAERIVEAYVRYVKGWATISNIRCPGQYEIDLLAVDPVNLNRYHIEVSVSVSGPYSKLTAKPFSRELLKERTKKAEQKRTLGYFLECKFNVPEVVETLRRYGFGEDYFKVIVSWEWAKEAEEQAKAMGVIPWDFRNIIRELSEKFKDTKGYFMDETLRTLQLFAKAIED